MGFFKISLFSLLVLTSSVTISAKEKEAATKFKQDKTSDSEEESEGMAIFNGFSIMVSGGLNFYFGDIADYNIFPKMDQYESQFKTGFKVSIAKNINSVLGLKFSYQSGALIGTRKTGKHSSVVSFENYFNDISFQPRLLISEILFKKNEYTRFKLYGQMGVGMMWFRTILYDPETFLTSDYEGYVELESSLRNPQKILSEKTAKATTLTIPYGITLAYSVNHKMDIHLEITQSSTYTDRLDAFDRGWTAKDKYNYIGLGITYNFNKKIEDGPLKRPKKTKEEDSDTSEDSKSASNSSSSSNKKGLFGKRNKKGNSNSGEEDKLLNVRLKLFETQLKLFEMQYLLGK
jgi:hypothetical protein